MKGHQKQGYLRQDDISTWVQSSQRSISTWNPVIVLGWSECHGQICVKSDCRLRFVVIILALLRPCWFLTFFNTCYIFWIHCFHIFQYMLHIFNPIFPYFQYTLHIFVKWITYSNIVDQWHMAYDVRAGMKRGPWSHLDKWVYSMCNSCKYGLAGTSSITWHYMERGGCLSANCALTASYLPTYLPLNMYNYGLWRS